MDVDDVYLAVRIQHLGPGLLQLAGRDVTADDPADVPGRAPQPPDQRFTGAFGLPGGPGLVTVAVVGDQQLVFDEPDQSVECVDPPALAGEFTAVAFEQVRPLVLADRLLNSCGRRSSRGVHQQPRALLPVGECTEPGGDVVDQETDVAHVLVTAQHERQQPVAGELQQAPAVRPDARIVLFFSQQVAAVGAGDGRTARGDAAERPLGQAQQGVTVTADAAALQPSAFLFLDLAVGPVQEEQVPAFDVEHHGP